MNAILNQITTHRYGNVTDIRFEKGGFTYTIARVYHEEENISFEIPVFRDGNLDTFRDNTETYNFSIDEIINELKAHALYNWIVFSKCYSKNLGEFLQCTIKKGKLPISWRDTSFECNVKVKELYTRMIV